MMKTTLPALASLLAALLFPVIPASAQLAFGFVGDPSAQPIGRSFLGDISQPSFPNGIMAPYVSSEANPAVTRGAIWTNLGPPCACATTVFSPPLWAARPALLAPGTPLLLGPVVTAENRDVCAAPVMIIAYYPVPDLRCVVPPLTLASAR